MTSVGIENKIITQQRTPIFCLYVLFMPTCLQRWLHKLWKRQPPPTTSQLSHWLSCQYRSFYTLTSSILCIRHETCWAETDSSVLFYLTQSAAAHIVGTSWNETEHNDVMERKCLKQVIALTHWGRVTYIWVIKATIIGSDNCFSPDQRHDIIWPNAEILLIGHSGPNFSEILIEIHTFSFNKMHLRMSSGKWQPYCLGLYVLRVRFVHGSCSLVFGYGLVQVNCYCPASRTTLVATRFRVAVICPIIQVPHCIRVFFYFVWYVFINHIFQFYHELCTYCNILDIYLS